MSDLDNAIRNALSAEDAAILDRVGKSPGLPTLLGDTFRGPFGLINGFGWILGFVLFGVAVFCGWRFMGATEMHAMLLWGGATMLAAISLGLVKLWFWMELQRNIVVREIKRLELQVARLAAGRS